MARFTHILNPVGALLRMRRADHGTDGWALGSFAAACGAEREGRHG
jgi:hypothetical protein